MTKTELSSMIDLEKHVKVVGPHDKVYKEECIFSFDTPESEDGLYICMKTFEAISADFIDYYFERFGHTVYLHHKRFRYKINKPESSETKPKRLAIGLEGGFDPDASDKDTRVEDVYSIMILPQKEQIAFPDPDLPSLVLDSVSSIMASESTELRDTANNIWDGEQRAISKYAENLEQLSNPPRVPPSDWKCEKCDKKDNLWLNLTDGSILCGRKFYDGSGGNNHAVEHYDECKYPLAVKLGTVTATSADVYSYPEEDMVIDPHLDKHLSHFGIDIQKMTKTEKSMVELEIDMNEKLGEWSIIQEDGKNLEPASGPGFTGLANLGNSCYMNSVLQVLFSIEDFRQRYFPPLPVYDLCPNHEKFNHQMAKLAYGLLSGKYSNIDQSTKQQKGIPPKSFKHIVCGQDRNFSTRSQQDAHEFLLFILDLIERNNSENRPADWQRGCKDTNDPTRCFEFVIEDRIQCSQSKKVKYTHRVESCLPLHVDLDWATNKEEVEAYKQQVDSNPSSPPDLVRSKIPFMACVEQFAKTETLTDFFSAAISAKTEADKSSKLSRFPQFMVFQMKKFVCGADWVPKKLDVAFDVPDILDLEILKGKGLQPGEEELEDTDSSPETAATASGEHSSGGSMPTIEPDSEAVATLLGMGIDVTQAITALKVCNNDAQRAIEYIFDPDSFQPTHGPSEQPRLTVATRLDPLRMKLYSTGMDTKPKLYQLKAFISHMGTSTACGHYVCHIKNDEKWYIFNDNKVAQSENPPKELGYLYFYERISE